MGNTNSIGLMPYFDRLFVKRDDTPDRTPGGLFIPESDKEKPNKGFVLAAGPDCRFSFEGQRIVFGQHHGVDIEFNGEMITILRENDIYAGDKKSLPALSEEEKDALKNA